MNFNIIKDLIAQGKISEALDKLLNQLEMSNISQRREVLFLSARYNLLLEESRKGIITNNEVHINENQIILHFLSILNDLEMSYPDKFGGNHLTEIEISAKIEAYNKNIANILPVLINNI